ncbi:MAG: hypothetical protein WC473_03470 [Patescibacteria group bacterium]|jgi:TM2 domain-containing membrane protein YozV
MITFILTILLYGLGIILLLASLMVFDSTKMEEKDFRQLIIAIALAAVCFLASLTCHVIMT